MPTVESKMEDSDIVGAFSSHCYALKYAIDEELPRILRSSILPLHKIITMSEDLVVSLRSFIQVCKLLNDKSMWYRDRQDWRSLNQEESWKRLTSRLVRSIEPTCGFYCSLCSFETLATIEWTTHLESSEHRTRASLVECDCVTCYDCEITIVGEPEKYLMSNEHLMLHKKLQNAQVPDSVVKKEPLETEPIHLAIPANTPSKSLQETPKQECGVVDAYIKFERALSMEEDSKGYYCGICTRSWIINDTEPWRQHMISNGHATKSKDITRKDRGVAARCNLCDVVIVSTDLNARQCILFHGKSAHSSGSCNFTFSITDLNTFEKMMRGMLDHPAKHELISTPVNAPSKSLNGITNKTLQQEWRVNDAYIKFERELCLKKNSRGYYCDICARSWMNKSEPWLQHVTSGGHATNSEGFLGKDCETAVICNLCGVVVVSTERKAMQCLVFHRNFSHANACNFTFNTTDIKSYKKMELESADHPEKPELIPPVDVPCQSLHNIPYKTLKLEWGVNDAYIKFERELSLEEDSTGYYCDICTRSWIINDTEPWRQHITSSGHATNSEGVTGNNRRVAARCNLCDMVVVSTEPNARRCLLFHRNFSHATDSNFTLNIIDLKSYNKMDFETLDLSEKENVAPNLPQSYRGYHCFLCSRQTLQVMDWFKHLASSRHGVRTTKSATVAECTYCELTIAVESEDVATNIMSQHVKEHDANRQQYSLTQMEQYYLSKRSSTSLPPPVELPLNYAKVTVLQMGGEGVAYYYCQPCDYYNVKKNLPEHLVTKKHKETHQPDQCVYTCDICGFSVVTLDTSIVGYMMHHMSRVHQGKVELTEERVTASCLVESEEDLTPKVSLITSTSPMLPSSKLMDYIQKVTSDSVA